MSKYPIPRDVLAGWFTPGRNDPAVRKDLARYSRGLPDRHALVDLAHRMTSFDKPVLVVWATQDKLMPHEHGRRLAELFPDGRLVEVDDSYTLVPQDQPRVLANSLHEFVVETPLHRTHG